MKTADKITAIETSGLELAFDGCHKIYVMEDAKDRLDMVDNGYDPEVDYYPADEVRTLINHSCFLVFVHCASLRDDFPWDIEQGELFEAFGEADV